MTESAGGEDGAADRTGRGNPDAPIVIAEFSDFACTHCQVFYMITFQKMESDLIKPGTVFFLSLNYYLNTPNHARAVVAGRVCEGNTGR